MKSTLSTPNTNMLLSFTEAEAEAFTCSAAKCNEILGTVHEGCSPYYTSEQRAKFGINSDYGGITGTIVPSHLSRIATLLLLGTLDGRANALSKELLLERHKSVFLDIGCGTGRPTYYFAKLELKCSMGFDIDELQVANSIAGYQKLESTGMQFGCPISFFKHDCMALDSLGPVTHAYAFVGYPEFAVSIAKLILTSPKLKVVVLVVLKRDELEYCGLVDDETMIMPGMRMGSGSAYLGVVIPVTKRRREAIIEALMEEKVGFSSVVQHDMSENPLQVRLTTALAHNVNGLTDTPAATSIAGVESQARPVRACSKRRLQDTPSSTFLPCKRQQPILKCEPVMSIPFPQLQDYAVVEKKTTPAPCFAGVEEEAFLFNSYAPLEEEEEEEVVFPTATPLCKNEEEEEEVTQQSSSSFDEDATVGTYEEEEDCDTTLHQQQQQCRGLEEESVFLIDC